MSRNRSGVIYGLQSPPIATARLLTCSKEPFSAPSPIDLFPLHHGFRKSIKAEIHEKRAESGDHGYHPKVRRYEERR